VRIKENIDEETGIIHTVAVAPFRVDGITYRPPRFYGVTDGGQVSRRMIEVIDDPEGSVWLQEAASTTDHDL
jgi:hypothetical protein